MKKENKSKKSRRNFIKAGITAGTSVIVGGSILTSLSKNSGEGSGEKTKVLTQDGKLVEVDKAHIHHQQRSTPGTSK